MALSHRRSKTLNYDWDTLSPAATIHNHFSEFIFSEENRMNKLYSFILTLTRDEEAQDMVEYALLAGFIAVAAGAILPNISDSISTIFSKMSSLVLLASTA